MDKNKHSIKLMNREIVFWLCFFVYSVLTFYLFYQQAITKDNRYLSDMPSYISGALGTNDRDPYPYRLFFWLLQGLTYIFPIGLSAAFSTLLLNSLTVLILKYYVERYFKEETDKDYPTIIEGILHTHLTTFIIFSSLMASMVIVPINGVYRFDNQYYIGQGSGNVWHNATYLATRPFATLAFFLFIEIVDLKDNKQSIKKLVLFSVSMFLTVFAKPTFALAMMPTAAIYLIYLLIKERFRNFRSILIISLTFIPAVLEALRQYFPVFKSSNEGGIGFGFGDVWSLYTKSIPLSILLCFLFPIFILCTNIKNKEHEKIILFSTIFAIITLFEGVFVYEKGIRMPDGNFLQPYLHAMFYLFIVSLIVWLTSREKKKRQNLYDITAMLFFLLHTVSGVWYFIHILCGNSFY